MESNSGSARRPSLIAAVDAARDGDAQAVDTVVELCRPELLRLARSIDAARAEPVVDELVGSFVGWLDRLHFADTPEVWFHLYQSCRHLMAGGVLVAPPEPAAEPAAEPEPVMQPAPAAIRTELLETPGATLRPRRLGAIERLTDVISARRSLITASLLCIVLGVVTAVAATRWETMNVLDNVNLVSVDGEGVAEPPFPNAVESNGGPSSGLGPGPAGEDGGRAVFSQPFSEPAQPEGSTTSAVAPETTTIESSTTSPTPPTTSPSTTVVPSTGAVDTASTSTTTPAILVSTSSTLPRSSTVPLVALDDPVSPTTTP